MQLPQFYLCYINVASQGKVVHIGYSINAASSDVLLMASQKISLDHVQLQEHFDVFCNVTFLIKRIKLD